MSAAEGRAPNVCPRDLASVPLTLFLGQVEVSTKVEQEPLSPAATR
jgi:hypothetical protein